MSLFGGSNRGLRAQVSNAGGGRWPLIVVGVLVVILVATWLLAPYLPSLMTKKVEEKKEPPVTTQAVNAVLNGAEWGYKAVMPPPSPIQTAPPPSVEQAPPAATQPMPASPPKTYQVKTTTPKISAEERRRLADEEERRAKAKQREHEEEVKRRKSLTWGEKSSKVEAGQLIRAADYSLSPGELIPCETEPILSNESPGTFRAFVSSHVYDSKTHRHIVVPQGTALNMQVGGRTIIAGDTRLPVEGLTMKFPDGDWMKFGQISISDRYGTPGFTGDVNRHIWRIIGSIFVTSVLRGGSTAIVSNSYDQGISDRMGAAAVAETTREGQQLTKQVLRTDPTITVEAVYGCYVNLKEPVTRPKPYLLVSAPGH